MSNPVPLPEPPKSVPQPKYEFTFTKEMRTRDTDPKTITIVEVSLAQELGTAAAMGSDPFAKVKLGIHSINGKPIDWASGGADAVLENASPKIREAIIKAFVSVNQITEEETEVFLASKTVRL